MKRREFIAGLFLLIATERAEAQQAQKVARIGVLANEPWPPIDGLAEGLRELGYAEGRNLRLEYRYALGRDERYPALAAELVALPVDVIVTTGTLALLAAKHATTTIPIVMATAADPVGVGAVSSLARPGGNITGFSSFNFEVEEKRLQLLKEILPSLSSVAVLKNPTNPFSAIAVQHAEHAAQAMGVRLDLVDLSTDTEFSEAVGALNRLRPDGALVIGDAFLLGHKAQIAQFMAETRLPAVYTFRDHTEAGGLMSYATNYRDLFRRSAIYVDKILRGAKPADLPVQQPTKFELVINLKAAKALGIEIPPSLFARADEVIE